MTDASSCRPHRMDGTVPDSPEELQRRFHAELFGALYSWETAHSRIVDLSGDTSLDGLLGLDQMGHFGPHGCDLVVGELRATGWPRIRLCEVGAGFGGALRYIVDRLHRVNIIVGGAVGVELVAEHCALARRIGGALSLDGLVLQADAANLPFRSASFDVVVATGSVPHFCDMAAVLSEASRALRPGGRLVLTEEVSLVGAHVSELPSDFRMVHPAGVFYTATESERNAELIAAGLDIVRHRQLAHWAEDLLTARLRAITLFKGSTERILGAEHVKRIVHLLEVTRGLYSTGVLVPRITVARRPSDGGVRNRPPGPVSRYNAGADPG